MSIIKKGTDFGATEQVTSTKLDNLVDNASFTDTSANAVAYTGSTGTCLNGGGLEVTSAGQLQIEDDGVTQAKTSFIDANGGMTLTGSSPRVILDDDGNSGTDPYIITDNTGSIGVYSTATNSDVIVDGNDEVRIRHNGTNGITVAADAGKDQDGNDVAGAKVSGGLYVTGDVYADDQVVGTKFEAKGSDPRITLSRTGVTTAPTIKGYDNGSIEVVTAQTDSDIILDAKDDVILQYENNTVFRASATAGKNASGTSVPGCGVEGSLEVDDDINVAGIMRAATIQIGTANILDLIHPVGSVISTTTNYADSAAVVADYGGTTWTRFSEGRMLAGYKSSDSDFSAGNEDGSKTVTLTKAQLPTDITDTNTKITFGGNAVPSFSLSGDFSFGGGPATNHQPSFGSGGTNPSKIVNLDIGGSGDSHENMPPYIVVYRYRRTA